MRLYDELEVMIISKYATVAPVLNERARRIWAATESLALGYGGDALVSAATGLARQTIRNGRREIELGVADVGRVRNPGAGRPSLKQTQPGLEAALERLVDPSRGDHVSIALDVQAEPSLQRLCERGLAGEFERVSDDSQAGRYCCRRCRSLGRVRHPDRNAQFEYIHTTAADYLQRRGIISVDTKKKGWLAISRMAGGSGSPHPRRRGAGA
jgi:hypothetical protein